MKPDLTHGQAVGWALSVLLAFWFVGSNVALAVPSLGHDLVLGVGVEVVVYLTACAVFSARRPGRSFEDLFAFRRAPVLLMLSAFVLGIALRAPVEFLQEAILHALPLPKAAEDQLAALLVPKNPAHAAALTLVVAVLGPFVEELLYRGALFTGLRSGAGAASSAVTTGLLFTMVHTEPRFWLPISLLAACLGFLRATSGSLWPGVLLHGAFNGTALVMAFGGPRVEAFAQTKAVVIGSTVASFVLVGVLAFLARGSAVAERARSLDGPHASEPGTSS